MPHISFSSFTLDNGLQVIVHEDHAAPRAVVNITYDVGSRDEDPGRTGFAHLFEHLMFGGSRNAPDYDRVLQLAGAENNAFTNTDITNYYISLPSSQLEIAFWLESDRMLELDFSQRSLDVQKSVVVEEFKQRYLNKPYGDAHHILREIHFQTHPYRWPTIGKDISHIEGAKLEDVKEFFFGFYAPNNATLVVAGDVNADQVKRLSEKWFGDIPRRTLNKKPLPAEPVQSQERRKTVHRDVPQPAVYKMYHIPARAEKAYYAADFLTDALSSGRAAHLHQRLVKERQLCTSVRAFSWGAHDPGMISIDAFLSKGITPEQYEAALDEEIRILWDMPERDMQRLKNTLESTQEMGYMSILNRAISLGVYNTLGDPGLINTVLSEYLQLTTDDVRRSAGEVLRTGNVSTLHYLPQA